jgi:hypothetical protein
MKELTRESQTPRADQADPNGLVGKAARRWLGRLIQDGPSQPWKD